METAEIKEMMNARAEEICAQLLPNGWRYKNSWTCGDVRGTAPSKKPSGSLLVELEGRGKYGVGTWHDFDTDEGGGDLIDLWMTVNGQSFKEAIREIKDWLGVTEKAPAENMRRVKASSLKKNKPTTEISKKEPPPDIGKMVEPLDPEGPVYRWLTGERGLDPAVLRDYRIGQARIWFGPKDGERDCVALPSYDEKGELKLVKFRDIGEKSNIRTAPTKAQGAKEMLFGIQSIHDDVDELIVCEGEIDAMSWYQMGHAAASVPFGAKGLDRNGNNPNDPWIRHDFDWLKRFERVLLAFDQDEAGQAAVPAIAPRVGRERAYAVAYPEEKNDANGMLSAGMKMKDFDRLVDEASDMDPESLKRVSDFREDLWNQIFRDGLRFSGDEMPFPIPFKLRPKEVTVWTGYSKHGKTVFLNYLLMHLASMYDRKCCVASLEMPAVYTLENAVRQILGRGKPADEDEFDRCLDWMDERMFIYDHIGVARSADIFETFEYAVKKYGVKHLVIDSVMKVSDVDEDDNNSQKMFMNQAVAFAMDLDVHLHIVAHSKKATQKYPEEKYWPKKHDVLGSVHITDIANNTVCVYRNRAKENRIAAKILDRDNIQRWDNDEAHLDGLADVDADLDVLDRQHDAMIIVEGQRGGSGETPLKQLWFDKGEDGSWRYSDERGDFGENWLRAAAAQEEAF